MNLNAKRILLTGAAGGIGRLLSDLLADRGAYLGLVDRDLTAVTALAKSLDGKASGSLPLVADITKAEDRERVVRRMHEAFGGIDILINLAGILDFKRFQDSDPGVIQRILQVNFYCNHS